MENYELRIEPEFNQKNGRFYPGHRPFNKGKKMTDWMDGRKIKKVKKYLEIGRKLGNHDLPGKNKIEIVGIKEGKLTAYKSSADAENILKAKKEYPRFLMICNGSPGDEGFLVGVA